MNHDLSVGSAHADPINAATNGHSNINGDLHREPSSPTADSPSTPVSNTAAPIVKLDTEFQELESDVRHEPVPVKSVPSLEDKPAVVATDDASTIAQIGTPVDPGPSFSFFLPYHF